MTRKQIERIFKSTPELPYENRYFAFREGLLILFDLFEESEDINAERNRIWYGSVDEVSDKLTISQCTKLSELGWFIDEDSFSFFT